MFFGANTILLQWVDNFLVFLIYHYVSNITPLMILGTTIALIVVFVNNHGGFPYFLIVNFYIAFNLVLWYLIMKISIDAIHDINPYWNKVAHGLLWPTITDLNHGSDDVHDSDKRPKEEGDEIADSGAM